MHFPYVQILTWLLKKWPHWYCFTCTRCYNTNRRQINLLSWNFFFTIMGLKQAFSLCRDNNLSRSEWIWHKLYYKVPYQDRKTGNNIWGYELNQVRIGDHKGARNYKVPYLQRKVGIDLRFFNWNQLRIKVNKWPLWFWSYSYPVSNYNHNQYSKLYQAWMVCPYLPQLYYTVVCDLWPWGQINDFWTTVVWL